MRRRLSLWVALAMCVAFTRLLVRAQEPPPVTSRVIDRNIIVRGPLSHCTVAWLALSIGKVAAVWLSSLPYREI